MSMISIYTEQLKTAGVDFDIIYMDKYGEVENFPSNRKYVYTNIINRKLLKPFRGLKYFKFISYAKKILKENKYDFIVIWNDVAILLFSKYLASHWRGKYCLNIRDYFHERNPLIYHMFKKAIRNSAFTTLSSPGYQIFLPKHKYIYINSLNTEILSKCIPRTALRGVDDRIRITFVGYVRFYDINKRLLNIFKNDNRFELHFYGAHSDILEEYSTQEGINNAFFGGAFPVEDTYKYIDKIDIINNLYSSGNISVDYALSIKLFYGLYMKTPILVEPKTYMEQFTNQYGIGYAVEELTDDLNDKIYDWYTNIDFQSMSRFCDSAMEKIKRENREFNKVIREYLIQ
jgi:hypothetical protein